jgi:hypothetical protein
MNQEPETDGYKWKRPKCENDNAMKLWKCGHCKAYERPRPKGGQYDAFDRNPQLCHFLSANGRQCPLPGVVSHEIGKDARRWCSGHLKDQSGPVAEQIYDDNVRNYDQIVAQRKDNFHNDPVGWMQRHRPEVTPGKKTEPEAALQDAEQRKRQAEELVERLQQSAPEGWQHVSEIVDEECGEYIQQENPHG